MSSTVIVVLTQTGLTTAERVRTAIGDAEIHGYIPRVTGADHGFDAVAEHLRSSFNDGKAIVGICAAGILIRALASQLGNKREEPPVIAVAEDGRFVVPLLGGHHGGNDLAHAVAAGLGVEAAVTTTSETRWRIALDKPPTGWRLSNPEHCKAFTARALAGERCRIEGECAWLEQSDLEPSAAGTLTLAASVAPLQGAPDKLVYCPQVFTLGVGCERGTSTEELGALVEQTLAQSNISPHALAGLYSVDLKSDERAVHEVAGALGVCARFFTPATLESLTPRLENPSEIVFKEVGCHGVAEAAALAGAGDAATLTVAKRKSTRATCAIARAAAVMDGARAGRARGRLTVVGLGPGKSEWRTPAATSAIRRATHVIGYSGYLAMLAPLDGQQTVRAYALGEEVERVDEALSLAALGDEVALVCSGDPGVYAMASLVFERLEGSADPSWARSAIEVLPGISAMHAAAARIGAPLGHDFCAISLSDLLTPWAVIERRLEAAAAGDFVVALYNPASMRRRRQLERAFEILATARPGTTPVVIARQVGRDTESISVTTLEAFDPAEIDMLTLLLIGSKESRRLMLADGERVYTPRGYIAKIKERATG